MDFLISFMVALIIIALVGVVSHYWSRFNHRNQMPEGWRESETQRILREAQEIEQWEISQGAIKEHSPRVYPVSKPAFRLPRKAG